MNKYYNIWLISTLVSNSFKFLPRSSATLWLEEGVQGVQMIKPNRSCRNNFHVAVSILVLNKNIILLTVKKWYEDKKLYLIDTLPAIKKKTWKKNVIVLHVYF